MSVREFGVSAALAGGAAVAASMLGIGVAHADGGTDEINGWTVTPTSDNVALLTDNATLSDPSNALGLGTSPIVGEWISTPATPLSSIGSNDQFLTPDAIGSDNLLLIHDYWWPGIEEATVQTGIGNSLLAFLVPAVGGKQVVDLFNFGSPDAPPLFNPDATGPIDVGGVELASPQDGALLNDLFDAVFTGDAAAWGKATTLFDDLFGIDSSGAVDVVASTGADAAGSAGSGGTAAAADTTTDLTPAQLLSEGNANLSDASTVLSGIDLTGQPSDIASIVSSDMGIIGSSMTIQDQLGMFQTEIVDGQMQLSGMPGYDLVSQATNYLLTQADESLLNADAAVLASDQALAATISDGSELTDADMLGGAEAALQLVGADFGAFGTTFDAAFTPFLELFAAF